MRVQLLAGLSTHLRLVGVGSLVCLAFNYRENTSDVHLPVRISWVFGWLVLGVSCFFVSRVGCLVSRVGCLVSRVSWVVCHIAYLVAGVSCLVCRDFYLVCRV